MSSSLTGKFIANTFQRLFQRSGAPVANGYESSVSFASALTTDSLTLLNGLGQKIKGFIFDRGQAGGDGGIYIQTENMKQSGDFGLRFNSINERGEITSKNKDILISSDFTNANDNLNRRRRLILKGGIPGSMSQTSSADELNGGPTGNQQQLTLQLQGRLTAEHVDQIVLDEVLSRIENMALMSGIYVDGDYYQMWQKVGNIVTVNGVWMTDGSGKIPVPLVTSNANEVDIIRSQGVADSTSNSGYITESNDNDMVIVYESGSTNPMTNTDVTFSYSYVLEF
jgi:hypothetical protein